MKNYLKKIKNIPKRIEREIEAFQYLNGRYADVLRILNTADSLSYREASHQFLSIWRWRNCADDG